MTNKTVAPGATEAKRTGANVMILTDFDTDGIKIALELEGVTRIGIDFESIDQINEHIQAELDGDDPFEPEAPEVEVEVDESIYKTHMEDLEPELDDILDLDELIEGRDATDTWTNLKYLTEGHKRKSEINSARVPIKGTKHERHYINYLNKTYDGDVEGTTKTYLEFLEENRIELNTIMTQIGPKRFWNWLYSQIIKTFPTRQYSIRVIHVPPYEITLPIMDKLNQIVDKLISECIREEALVIIDELYKVKGLLNTDVKMDQIHDRLTDKVDEDENLTKFSKKLERLIKSQG